MLLLLLVVGYAKIQIMGNLGGPPELKFLPSGDPVVNFSVAVNRRFKDREGKHKEATEWFRVRAFNDLGEVCAKFLQKGDGVFLEGRLQVRQYDSKQTGKEVSVEIIPSVVRFLGSCRAEGSAHGMPAAAVPKPDLGADSSAGEIPF
jgi:single-strand DNA-binding protein